MDTNAPLPNAAPEEGHPEKYVRTFAGDMETLKGGGTPNLTPLPESHNTPVPSASVISQQEMPPLPDTGLLPPLQSQAPQPVAAPEPSGPTSLKTYAGDFLDRVKDTNASPMTVLAAEQDSAQGAPYVAPQEPPRTTIPYIIIGVVLLIAGAVGAYVASTYYRATMAPVVLAPSVSAPIFVDDREQVSGSGAALMRAIEQSVNTPITSGSIRLLYMASSTDTGSVFSMLGVSAPNVLLRNIQAAGSMAGIVNAGGIQSPFFILSVSSYSDTFSGMLTWEPMMRRDLITLFPPYPVTSAASTTATSTPPVSPPALSAMAFTDSTVANHDVRIYNDTQGRSIILYGYWNQTTLVIARDPASFTEIVQRLATSRTQ